MPVSPRNNSLSPIQASIGNQMLLTREECAAVLRIHLRTLDALRKEGTIRFKRVGKPVRGRVLVPRVEVERFLEVGELTNSCR
jgi:excisionase family DNA binding protein